MAHNSSSMKNGVYRIRNIQNDKCYIGSAAGQGGLKERWRLHRHYLIKNGHHSTHLQHAWNKYGESSFVFEILEECIPAICIEREQYYLDTILFASRHDKRFRELGYNICRIANSCLGIKRSEKSKQKMRGPRPHMTGSANPMYGKKGKACPNHGLKRSEATKLSMSKARSKFLNKLKDADKLKIKQLLQEGYTQRQVAKMFKVCHATIGKINNNKIWRNR